MLIYSSHLFSMTNSKGRHLSPCSNATVIDVSVYFHLEAEDVRSRGGESVIRARSVHAIVWLISQEMQKQKCLHILTFRLQELS